MKDPIPSPSPPTPVPSKIPEALQAPTKPVSIGFSLLLTASRTVVFLCSASIGGLLLPLQVEQIDPVNWIRSSMMYMASRAVLQS